MYLGRQVWNSLGRLAIDQASIPSLLCGAVCRDDGAMVRDLVRLDVLELRMSDFVSLLSKNKSVICF